MSKAGSWMEENPFLYWLFSIKKKIEVVFFYKQTIARRFERDLGYKMNLKNPVTFNEKIQWRKIYDHNPMYTKCADKYEVRQYVIDKIGEEYLIELYGVYDTVDEIDIEKLPDTFVLKPNNSAGKVIICTDKKIIDWKKKRK